MGVNIPLRRRLKRRNGKIQWLVIITGYYFDKVYMYVNAVVKAKRLILTKLERIVKNRLL
jgi:hypothetical protein